MIWILGTPENWDPEIFGEFLLNPTNDNEFFWQYHQHGAKITPNGNILLYDNGNFRASPFDPPLEEEFSRAVEYKVDQETMEITQVWEYGQFASERIYTDFLGDSDFLPKTGNVLITFGGIRDPERDPERAARIIEVTHTTPAEVVFDLSMEGDNAYRSERISSLYP